MDSADTLRTRWITEAQRLTLYRRQRVCVHRNTTRTLEEIIADAEDLDCSIALTKALMEELEDQLNAATPGTYEYASRQAVPA